MFIFLTIVSSILYSSLVEYCLHRFFLHHSPKQKHIQNHHKIFHGIKSYELSEVNADDIVSSKKYIFSNIAFTFPLIALIFVYNKFYAILFLAISFVYTLWQECLHYYYHKDTHNILQGFKFFQRLKEHHRIHHYIYNTNYGLACRLWDVVFRTKK